jgi:hypothetical protein
MSDEPTKEGRPPGLEEGGDPDTPQDPGIPGPKVEEEQTTEWEPSTPERGFPEDAEDERARAREAEADDSLAPGSMPPQGDS